MKIVVFDLGNTLLDDNAQLLPGALETLTEIQKITGPDEKPLELALLSDYFPASSPEESERIHQQYYQLLDQVGLTSFFNPLNIRVTLSTEVGVHKPDARTFQTVARKLTGEDHVHDMLFVTENPEHVLEARKLGISAIHFNGPGQPSGDVDFLPDLIPLVEQFVNTL